MLQLSLLFIPVRYLPGHIPRSFTFNADNIFLVCHFIRHVRVIVEHVTLSYLSNEVLGLSQILQLSFVVHPCLLLL